MHLLSEKNGNTNKNRKKNSFFIHLKFEEIVRKKMKNLTN